METSQTSIDIDTSLPIEQELSREDSPKTKSQFFQVNLFKSWMILLVIMDHSFTHAFLQPAGSIFWERIAIPGFMVVMGFNAFKSFDKKGATKLKELYTKDYFKKKIERYIIPYLIYYAIQALIRVLVDFFEWRLVSYTGGYEWKLGHALFYGPGIWFMPVLFGSILVIPLLYFSFKRNFIGTFFGAFVIEFFMHVGVQIVFRDPFLVDGFPIVYLRGSIYYLLSGPAIGMWIANKPKMDAIQNTIIYFLWLASLIYMLFYFRGIGPRDSFLYLILVPDYHMLTFGWIAMIFLIIVDLVPNLKTGKAYKFFTTIGKSTYHILLAQMFYFSLIYHFTGLELGSVFDGTDLHPLRPLNYIWYFPLNVGITFILGIAWKNLEDKFLRSKTDNLFLSITYKILLVIGILFFVTWQIFHVYLGIFEVFPHIAGGISGFFEWLSWLISLRSF